MNNATPTPELKDASRRKETVEKNPRKRSPIDRNVDKAPKLPVNILRKVISFSFPLEGDPSSISVDMRLEMNFRVKECERKMDFHFV